MEFSAIFNGQLAILLVSLLFLVISNYVGERNVISRRTGVALVTMYIIYSIKIFMN